MASWGDCVSQMAAFYQQNIHTYQGHAKGEKSPVKTSAWIACPLLGGNVRDDCSGFVSACLQLAGVFNKGFLTSSGEFANANGVTGQKLKAGGFQPLPFNAASLQPGDIYSGNNGKFHHVEICAGGGKTYSWGSVHDTSHGGMPSAMCKGAYTIIWRPANGATFSMAAGGICTGNVLLRYDVPRSQQHDNQLMNHLKDVKLNLLAEILESTGILFDNNSFKKIHLIDDFIEKKKIKYTNTDSKWAHVIKDNIAKWYDGPETSSKILHLDSIGFDDVRYNNSMGEDSSISEGIALNAIELGIFPQSFFGGTGDAAADFGDLFELSDQVASHELANKSVIARATEAIKYLMKFGLSKQAACAAVGTFISENHCRPDSFCAGEKSGHGAAGGPGDYGAGIASWTYKKYKDYALSLIGKPPGTPIESLSMEEQCKMYATELLQKKSNPTVNKILNGSVEEATVASMFKTHGDARDTLRQYGYTYKAAYEEQLLQTVRLLNWSRKNGSNRTEPSTHHKTGLLARILMGSKLNDMINV